MPRYGIAPQLSSHWFPDGHPYEIGLHHCGKCMNPFLTGDDCVCHCHEHATETRGINRSAARRTSGRGIGPREHENARTRRTAIGAREMSEAKTKYREPWYLSNDNGTEEWCITDGVETFPLAEASPAEFGLALKGTIERAHAVSLPDRETLAKAALKAYSEWANLSPLKQMSFNHPSLGEMFADAVLAALSTQPRTDDYEAGYEEGFHHGRSTPIQPAAGEVEYRGTVRSGAPDAGHTCDTDCYEDQNLVEWHTYEDPEVQPDPAPELAELFPGTLAALDHLSIRPEAQ